MTDAERERLKQAVCERVDSLSDVLLGCSRDIHAHPELNFAEHYAHDRLAGELERAGLAPVRGAHGIATSFRCDLGRVGPRVAVLLEYDALPEIGHACGHNIIAASGLGAGLALASVLERCQGRLSILGTPAEEGGGGKIALGRVGAFDDIDMAMMVHPADADLLRMDTIALQALDVSFEGKEAHAAAAPHEGRNALDAAVLAYLNAATLRQHIRSDERVHGIFTKAGDKANIVPKEAAMQWYARSPSIATLQPLKARLEACMEAGAQAAGCACTCTWGEHAYSDMWDNAPMAAAYALNSARLGRQVADPAAVGRRVVGSTDMGNVSHLVPSIHPMIRSAPDGVPIHTREFARWAESDLGDRAVLDGAKAMAMTVVDLWCDAGLTSAVRAEFDRQGPDRSVLEA